jgi:hypothetical protein
MNFPAKWIQKNGNIVPHIRIIILAIAYSGLGLYLFIHGQPLICPCGYVEFWGTGSGLSQQIADWYSLSHFLHGMLIVLIWRVFFPKVPMRYAFLAGIVTAVSWEVIEHTNYVMERFRQDTASTGYYGDAVINSMSDATIMSIGLYIATRLRIYHILIVFAVLEIVGLLAYRDSLILSTIMLIHPIEAIKVWQLGG